jgi:hypothetical protein
MTSANVSEPLASASTGLRWRQEPLQTAEVDPRALKRFPRCTDSHPQHRMARPAIGERSVS